MLVSTIQQLKSAIIIHTSPLSGASLPFPHPSRLSQSTKLTAASYQLSILHMIVYNMSVLLFPFSHPLLPPLCLRVHSNELDDPRAYCTEWRKSEREKQISCITTYMWNLERWYWWTHLEWRHRRRRQTGGRSAGRRGWDGSREQHGNIHTTVCKIDGRWESAVRCRELKPGALWQPGGVDGVGGGREVPEGGDIWIPVADSCCCMAETNTIL